MKSQNHSKNKSTVKLSFNTPEIRSIVKLFNSPYYRIKLIYLSFILFALLLIASLNLSVNILKKVSNYPSPIPTPIFCGGIAGIPCPTGFTCKYDGNYPDTGGICIPN